MEQGATVDPIANMITSIKNAQVALNEVVEIPASRVKLEIVKVLKKEGFIEDGELLGSENKKIRIKLKYRGKRPAITNIVRISKPGRRVYTKNKKIPVVLNGFGIVIMSTPLGIMTGKEAKKKGVGGELICKVW